MFKNMGSVLETNFSHNQTQAHPIVARLTCRHMSDYSIVGSPTFQQRLGTTSLAEKFASPSTVLILLLRLEFKI
jgi:hypothetical protein